MLAAWSCQTMKVSPVNPMRRFYLSGLASLALAACRPVTLLNAVIPAQDLRIDRDVAFGPLPRQRLDIYRPRQVGMQPRPVVLFFYGGSWDSGSKQDYLFVAEALCSQGCVVVIADYRLYPEVKFPALMQDPALAVQWVLQHVVGQQDAAQQLFLMGHSAGAHLVTLLLLKPDYLAALGVHTQQISGGIGLSGPYDFLPLTSDRLRAIFGPAEQEAASQPIRYARAEAPPLLLMTGLKDNTVWPRNSLRLADAIKAARGRVQVKTYADYGHVDMVAKLARPLRGRSPLLSDIMAWIQQHGG